MQHRTRHMHAIQPLAPKSFDPARVLWRLLQLLGLPETIPSGWPGYGGERRACVCLWPHRVLDSALSTPGSLSLSSVMSGDPRSWQCFSLDDHPLALWSIGAALPLSAKAAALACDVMSLCWGALPRDALRDTAAACDAATMPEGYAPR